MTILILSGFELPDPTENAVPSVVRIIGPVDGKEAVIWLSERGFSRRRANVWHRGENMFQQRDPNDGIMRGTMVACIVGEIKILDPISDVEIRDVR